MFYWLLAALTASALLACNRADRDNSFCLFDEDCPENSRCDTVTRRCTSNDVQRMPADPGLDRRLDMMVPDLAIPDSSMASPTPDAARPSVDATVVSRRPDVSIIDETDAGAQDAQQTASDAELSDSLLSTDAADSQLDTDDSEMPQDADALIGDATAEDAVSTDPTSSEDGMP